MKDSLFSVDVIRGLLEDAEEQRKSSETYIHHIYGTTLARFAVWLAAVEGAVDLVPEIAEMIAALGDNATGGTYADFHGPLDTMDKVLHGAGDADLTAEMALHPSARVRYSLAGKCRKALAYDPEPTVRFSARHQYTDPECDPPWWRGVLGAMPADVPSALAFGELALELRNVNDWSKAYQIAEAFQKLPAEMAGEIAPMFVSALWCPASWVDVVWKALLQAPVPLDVRVARAEKAIDMLVSSAPVIESAHGPAIDAAIQGCPEGERATFEPAARRVRAALEPDERVATNAPWTPAVREPRSPRGAADLPGSKARKPARSRKGAAASKPALKAKKASPAKKEEQKKFLCPPGLFERLVRELAEPGEWGASRFAQHPRARFELGRGLECLWERSPMLGDAATTARHLANIVGSSLERRPNNSDAMSQALAGLLRGLDLNDPIWRKLAAHASPAVREAVALSGLTNDTRHVEALLSDPDQQVWMAARMACTSREPWRGLLPSDPFEGCLPDEATALVPALVDLDRAVPLVRRRCLFESEADWVRIGRAAQELPAALARAFVPRMLPDDHLERCMAFLASALLSAEGGWETWVSEVERRVAAVPNVGWWFASYLVHSAVEQGLTPPDGGPPARWDIERRRAAAADALRKAKHAGPKSEPGERWLQAAVALWPEEDDPWPLPGPWSDGYPPYCVRQRLERTTFRPEWRTTQALLEGARDGFDEWSYFSSVEPCLDRLPADMQLDIALEGFWRGDSFGEWSQKKLGDSLSAARGKGSAALAAHLGDPRLARHEVLRADRKKHTMFVLRARLAARLADFAEALFTLTLVALDPKAEAANEEELAGYRAPWTVTVQAAMTQGPGGVRGALVTLAPPGLWEPLDRSFVHAVASDATLEEAQAVARRLATSGDAADLVVATELSERYPTAAAWPSLLQALGERVTD
jgi:hypothetical protein